MGICTNFSRIGLVRALDAPPAGIVGARQDFGFFLPNHYLIDKENTMKTYSAPCC
jgi:hypothetical protein